MIIETKYSLGDKVYIISRRSEQIWVDCKSCDGTGEVELKDGKHRCPTCYGRKGSIEYQPSKWMVGMGETYDFGSEHWNYWPKIGTVGQVRATIEKKEHEVQYMLKETGVGSGTLWSEDNLYNSLEEAQKECDIRNIEETVK